MDDVAAAAGVTRLIVYRHFATKEELYRAVLERVTLRLADAMDDAARAGGGDAVVARILAVARDDPDAFTLLWVQARREPAFVDYAEEVRRGAASFGERVLGERVPAGTPLHAWAVDLLVTATIEAVLGWLDKGDAVDDEAFVALAFSGLAGLVASLGPAGPSA